MFEKILTKLQLDKETFLINILVTMALIFILYKANYV